MKLTVNGIAAVLGGVAAYLWGPWDAPIIALLVVVTLDYLTGVANAVMQRSLSSEIGFHGLLRKVMIFLLVGLASVLDGLISGTNGALRTAVCLFYVANEGLSILENAAAMGLPLPEAIRETLSQLGTKK